MNPQTWQLISAILTGAVLLVLAGVAKWITAKADKAQVAELKLESENKSTKVELNRVESETKGSLSKLETKVDAALLVVAQSITRPELAEKLTAISGRADDARQRIIADIVELNTETRATAKTAAETDKKLNDLPGRVRTLEERDRK